MLPGPYERWFVELCGRAAPVESRSTCDACAMLPGAPELPPEGPFDEALRCCTYHPNLAPHFVGGILDGGDEVGRARVRARIAARVGVSPLGLGPTPEYAAAHRRLAGPGSFGRSRALACPFLDGTRCSIWRHRGAACAAFHCKLDRGALGAGLWSLLVVAFNAVERALARWLLARHGLDAAACDALLHAPADAALDARAWGAWRGREEEYFVAAARWVEAMTWAEVAALDGLHGLGDALRGAVARFDSPALPERVRPNREILYQLGKPGHTRLQNRGVPLDLVEIPTELATQLTALDETATANLGLEDVLLRRLLDWQVLLPV